MPSLRSEVARISAETAYNRWDFGDGFRQFALAPAAGPPSTVRGTKGLLEFLSLPQGWLVSPGEFNGGIQTGFLSKLSEADRKVTAQYVDDIAQASFAEDRLVSVRRCVDMIEAMLIQAEALRISFRL